MKKGVSKSLLSVLVGAAAVHHCLQDYKKITEKLLYVLLGGEFTRTRWFKLWRDKGQKVSGNVVTQEQELKVPPSHQRP